MTNGKCRPAKIATSLSARRAWIEICIDARMVLQRRVALRKESVDRNLLLVFIQDYNIGVALRKESVDRNSASFAVFEALVGRSPQGERG